MLLPQSAIAGPRANGTYVAPFASALEEGGCQHWGTPGTTERCRPFPYGQVGGLIGGYMEIESGDFGRYPLLTSNAGYTQGTISATGTLRKAASVLPITVRIQIDEATAQFLGSRVSTGPMRAYARFTATFKTYGSYASIVKPLIDIDPATDVPDSYSGEFVITLEATNVPKGDFVVEVRAFQFAEMFRGDTGEVVVHTPATLTSVTVG